MKEFINTVKRTFQVGRQEVLGYSMISLVSGLLGIILMLIILEVADENEYLAMGGLMAIMISTLLLVFGGIFSLLQDFNLAISFGRTRKHYVPAKYLLTVANCLICTVITVLIGLFEKFFYVRLYPGARNLLGVDFLLDHPAIMVAFVLLIPMAVMLLGALFAKFGMKFFWVCWVLWMLSFTALPKMITATHDDPDSVWGKMGTVVVEMLKGIDETNAMFGIIITGIGGVVIAFLILRKQRVSL